MATLITLVDHHRNSAKVTNEIAASNLSRMAGLVENGEACGSFKTICWKQNNIKQKPLSETEGNLWMDTDKVLIVPYFRHLKRILKGAIMIQIDLHPECLEITCPVTEHAWGWHVVNTYIHTYTLFML